MRRLGSNLFGEDGAVAVDAVIMAPFLLLSFISGGILCDGIRTSTTATQATYVIADDIARTGDVSSLNQAVLDELGALFSFLVADEGNPELRVFVVDAIADPDGSSRPVLIPKCGFTTDEPTFPLPSTMAEIDALVPEIAANDHAFVVESTMSWVSGMKMIPDQKMEHAVAARARFTAQLCGSIPDNAWAASFPSP